MLQIRSYVLLAISGLILASCQATSGTYTKFDLNCSEVSHYDTEMNWELWGGAEKIETCTGASMLLERYRIHNGQISYQGATGDYEFFTPKTDRTFREALADHKFFKSNWKTVHIRSIDSNSRHVMYSLFEWPSSDKYCVYFSMGHGLYESVAANGGWKETSYGSVCGPAKMTREEFVKDFETRIHAYNPRGKKGEKNTAGFSLW